ncbi:MAG: DUF4258 domain-containing protein [Candidatus Scalinduaceae bacterium]
MSKELSIEISSHAKEQMFERGVSENEVRVAIRQGEEEPARKGRFMYKKNFSFKRTWRGKKYNIKQVVPLVAKESDKLIVVTVYAYYF